MDASLEPDLSTYRLHINRHHESAQSGAHVLTSAIFVCWFNFSARVSTFDLRKIAHSDLSHQVVTGSNPAEEGFFMV